MFGKFLCSEFCVQCSDIIFCSLLRHSKIYDPGLTLICMWHLLGKYQIGL